MSREGISVLVIRRQLGHADLAITSRYLRGIDNTEIIAAVHERPAPMIPADREPRLVVEPWGSSRTCVAVGGGGHMRRPVRRARPALSRQTLAAGK
jgi:hypothetical protein